MQDGLSASRWASPAARREQRLYDESRSTSRTRMPSPSKKTLPLSNTNAPNLQTVSGHPPGLLTPLQRQYQARKTDLMRFRKLFRRLTWKASSLTFWSHRALTLAQEHTRHSLAQNGIEHGHPSAAPSATLGSYSVTITPIEAERQFKIDFFEFYALLERALVCLLGVWGVSVSADPAREDEESLDPGKDKVGAGNSIIGDSQALKAAHRYHANVLLALDAPTSPLYATLGPGSGVVREYVGVAKEFRNKWKDVEETSDEDFRTGQGLEEWDDRKVKRYAEVLRDLRLEEMLGGLLRGLEQGGGAAEFEVRELETRIQRQGQKLVDVDMDMVDAPFESGIQDMMDEMEF